MIEELVKLNLLAIVAAYRKTTKKSLATVSNEFYGNATFFSKLGKGQHSISVKKLDEVIAKFREKWPEKAVWPMLRPIFMSRQPQD